MPEWTVADIPDQTGRLAIVTGTGGLGYETALALVAAGADVVLAGRNPTKGARSIGKVRALYPAANIRFVSLDLADLGSVADFARQMRTEQGSLDILVNNAGVMMPPARKTTVDGFELQFGTNYLGHFALTAQLMPLLLKSERPRLVNLASIAHRAASIHFDDLQWEKSYKPWPSYGQSKLAMLMFALELQRRSEANGWGLQSIAAHPGFARTELITNGRGDRGGLASAMVGFGSRLVNAVIGHSAAAGALPTLFAATAPQARPGQYYGPDGFMELKGAPAIAEIKPQALDKAVAAKLWAVSLELTGVSFPDAPAAVA